MDKLILFVRIWIKNIFLRFKFRVGQCNALYRNFKSILVKQIEKDLN